MVTSFPKTTFTTTIITLKTLKVLKSLGIGKLILVARLIAFIVLQGMVVLGIVLGMLIQMKVQILVPNPTPPTQSTSSAIPCATA